MRPLSVVLSDPASPLPYLRGMQALSSPGGDSLFARDCPWPGLIDAHYRGELKVCAINLDPSKSIHIERGERIAQLVIQQVPVVSLLEVDELDETDRGTGGFGSSGV